MDRLAIKRKFLGELRDYSKGALADELRGLRGPVEGEESLEVEPSGGLESDLSGELSPEAEAELEGEDLGEELSETPTDELTEGELDLDNLDPETLALLLKE